MKVTRKMGHEMPHVMMERGENEEIAPSLRLSHLPKEIEGLEAGKDFEGHIKGKCVSHECREHEGHEKEGEKKKGGMHHHYELEVHHFDHEGKGAMKKKKSVHEETKEAFDKWDEQDKAKKTEKKDEKEVDKQEKGK